MSISFVSFLLGFRIAFELPKCSLELIGARFWRQHLRYAIIILVIIVYIIAPGGSGVAMWFFSIPLKVLHLIGIFGIERKETRRKIESTR